MHLAEAMRHTRDGQQRRGSWSGLNHAKLLIKEVLYLNIASVVRVYDRDLNPPFQVKWLRGGDVIHCCSSKATTQDDMKSRHVK